MGALILVGTIGALVIAVVLGKPLVREWRRKALMARPFPGNWERILEKRVPIYRRLPAPLRQQLRGKTRVLLNEKQFIGCAGLELTNEIKVTIAAQAALLLLNRKTDYYAKLASILVYPSAFLANHDTRDEAGVLSKHERVLSGESWDLGKIVVSWDDVERGARDFSDGGNVVLHEFAHQLDQESGSANGAPLLASRSSYQEWSRVLGREYEALREKAAHGQSSLLDQYGALNPGEFFAVATETFFERPALLQTDHPELYRELQDYYKVDPVAWH